MVFQAFYYDLCLRLDPYHTPYNASPLARSFVEDIRESFCKYAYAIIRSLDYEMHVHQQVLSSFESEWQTLFSNHTCFSCLARPPENTLTCDHSLCDICTMSHGCELVNDPWTFQIQTCPFCNVSNQVAFKLKPATAGVRALIVEGGGVRGVIPLSFLKRVHQTINLPLKIQEHFDIAVGSSAGTNSWPHSYISNLCRCAYRPWTLL